MTAALETDFWHDNEVLRAIGYEGILRRAGRNRPIYLRIETANTCNNDCVICAYGDQTRAKEIMSHDVFEKAVRDYVDIGGGFLSFTPLVGDFFLDRYLIARLRFLEKVPEITELGVTTNAAMAHRFSDAELEYILSRFKYVSISVYGVDLPEYERMTRKKTYGHMVQGIRRILNFFRGEISLEFRLLNTKSKADLEHWVRSEIRPDPYAAYKINSVITDYANWGIYDQNNNPLAGDAKWFAAKKEERRPQCLIPMFACIVYSGGNVSFCPCDNFDDVEELRLGNIKDTSLAEMYNSQIARELWNWDRHGTPEFCKSCSFHIGFDVLRSDPEILTNPHKIVGGG
ncbi:MAG: radical SAM protein [Rhizomicrobium sp.]